MVRRLFESKTNKVKSDSKDNKISTVPPVDDFVDIFGLNVESSKPPDPKPENTGNESDFLIFNQDPTFKEPLKEIAIDAEPMDFTDTTPQSVTDSDKLTQSSNESKLTLGAEPLEKIDQLDYLDFESVAFEEHKNRELADSLSEDNAFSDLETVENKTNSKQEPDKADPNKEEFRETEFAKFYDTSYSTELHGDTIVGAFIISHKNSKTEYLFSYPPTLNVNRSYDTKLLKSQYKTESYTANRDTNSELQSCFHLLSDLALGARKNNSLADFAHFVLPTSSSNVLYGTSYVIQVTDEIQVKTENPEKNSTETTENESELKEKPEGPTLTDTGSDETPKQLVKKTSSQYSSGHFVAICLVYKVPFFGLIGSRLEYLAQTYFDNKNFHDHSLLQSFLEHVNKNDKVEDWSYESLFFNLEYHFKPFSLCLSYRALLFLLKSILTEQRIMIYSECAARTSTCILSLLTMIPCASSLNFNSKAFGSLWFNWKRYGFPLDLFRSDNPIYPYFTESMSPLLNEVTGYLIGVTDLKILNELNNPPTLIFDLEEEIIRLRTKVLLGYYSPSFYEISFFDDFELLDELDIDDEPLKMVVDTSENIFNFVGDYLSRAPSTIIELGGKASKIYHMGRRLGIRRHKESYLRLFDIYFPGALPKFLRFSKKGSKSKKKKAKESEKGEKTEEGLDKVEQPDGDQKDKVEQTETGEGQETHHAKEKDQDEEKNQEESTDKFSDVGENDEVGAQDRASEYKKIKGFDPLGELKAQWDELTKQDDEDGRLSEVAKEEQEEDLAVVNTTFTFEMMFEKMMKRSPKYRYLAYVQYLQCEDSKDRNREIEYAILTRIQPLRDFLLKLLKSFAYAGGKARRPYHLLMDFFFELDSVIDFNNPVEGVYIVRGDEYLRGCMQELPDSDAEEHREQDESYKKTYIMEGDQEVKLKLPSILATHVVEIQNNYSIDFVELWIRTHNFKEFYMNHNLEVFNEPVFYVSQNVAKYTYPNGDFYVGELVDMLRDGKGSYVSKDGSRYDGGWLRDKRHGKGTLITNDIKYTGDWLNDKKHGFGRLETRTYTYVGDFRHNRCHGNGTMSYKSGIKQKGEFKHGRFEGKGMMTMPDGSVRMGNFKNGAIFGVCSVIDKTGKVYVGQLHGDLFHGKGILKYNKSTSFEGYWLKGRRVNQGMINTIVSGLPLRVEAVWQDDNMLMNEVSIKFPNGFKYNGSLKLYPHRTLKMEDLKDDSEFMKLDPSINEEDLKLFAQEFNKLDNKLLAHGSGIYKDTKGEVYNGLFFYGSKHGSMSQVFPNGTIYTGQYHLGRLHGKGTFQLLTKRTLEVKFNRGNLETELDFQDHSYIKQFLDLEYPTFVEEFVKYKLDSLMDVMKTSNILGFNM